MPSEIFIINLSRSAGSTDAVSPTGERCVHQRLRPIAGHAGHLAGHIHEFPVRVKLYAVCVYVSMLTVCFFFVSLSVHLQNSAVHPHTNTHPAIRVAGTELHRLAALV